MQIAGDHCISTETGYSMPEILEKSCMSIDLIQILGQSQCWGHVLKLKCSTYYVLQTLPQTP